MRIIIPECLHICPGCNALTEGEEYCPRCAEELDALDGRFMVHLESRIATMPREFMVTRERPSFSVWEFCWALLLAVVVGVWLWSGIANLLDLAVRR